MSRRAISRQRVNPGTPSLVSRTETAKSDPLPPVEGRSGHQALVEAHYGRLQRLCELLLGDREEAREVVQDVFMKAYEAAGRSGPPADWVAWLTRIAINACRDRRRAGWWFRFRYLSERVEELPLAARDPGPVDAAIGEETRRRIWRAFERLPGRQREVFVLRYIEDIPTAQVAMALGLSLGSVKRHLFRAIRRLREALGSRG